MQMLEKPQILKVDSSRYILNFCGSTSILEFVSETLGAILSPFLQKKNYLYLTLGLLVSTITMANKTYKSYMLGIVTRVKQDYHQHG